MNDLLSQGYTFAEDGTLTPPSKKAKTPEPEDIFDLVDGLPHDLYLRLRNLFYSNDNPQDPVPSSKYYEKYRQTYPPGYDLGTWESISVSALRPYQPYWVVPLPMHRLYRPEVWTNTPKSKYWWAYDMDLERWSVREFESPVQMPEGFDIETWDTGLVSFDPLKYHYMSLWPKAWANHHVKKHWTILWSTTNKTWVVNYGFFQNAYDDYQYDLHVLQHDLFDLLVIDSESEDEEEEAQWAWDNESLSSVSDPSDDEYVPSDGDVSD